MNQRKDSCSKYYAICSIYEGNVPSYSDLNEEECISLEETTQDLYSLVTEIKEDIDVTDLDFDCLTAPTTLKPVNVLQLLLQEICALKELTTTQAETIETMQESITALQENQCP